MLLALHRRTSLLGLLLCAGLAFILMVLISVVNNYDYDTELLHLPLESATDSSDYSEVTSDEFFQNLTPCHERKRFVIYSTQRSGTHWFRDVRFFFSSLRII